MNTLIIDCSTSIEFLAYIVDDKIYASIYDNDFNHSSNLFISLDKIFSSAKADIKNVDRIICGIGPGSFTGIRIAVSTARILSQIIECKIAGIYSQHLFLLSLDNLNEDYEYLIAFDAKKNKVFGGLYQFSNNSIIEIVETGDHPIEQILKKLTNNKKTIAIGNGCERYKNIILNYDKNAQILFNYIPDNKNILKNKMYFDKLEYHNDYNKILPYYARKSDAEIMKEKN